MSDRAPPCPRCGRETQLLDVGDVGVPRTFAVLWGCERCVFSNVAEVFGLHATTPAPGSCLACGEWVLQRLGRDHRCDRMFAEVEALLDARRGSPIDPGQLTALHDDGLFVLALCAVNRLLLGDRVRAESVAVATTIYRRLGRDELDPAVLHPHRDRRPARRRAEVDVIAPEDRGEVVEVTLRWDFAIYLHRRREVFALATDGHGQWAVDESASSSESWSRPRPAKKMRPGAVTTTTDDLAPAMHGVRLAVAGRR